MKYIKILIITIAILIAAFIVGCAEQDAVIDNGDDQNALQDDEATESIDDDDDDDDDDDETEASEDLSEMGALEDNDVPEAEEFSSSANPFQFFSQARENNFPIVLKFYSDT